ncbi:MAG TPA: response regulator transcription factor, partial [Nonomuraea sp.]|nr:response regulator transcription factor [Nonomuraea sp.]
MTPDRDSAKALVVDDEPHILRAVRNALAGDFAAVLEATTAREAVDLAAAQRPDVVVLDLGLPDKPGLWVLTELRKWSAAPVIVLSAQHSEAEKVRLLNEGADDYVTKPFSPRELLARIRAVLRRVPGANDLGPEEIHVGSLTLYPRRFQAEVDGRP